MKICALGCGHFVGKGDRHAKGFCPPRRGSRAGRKTSHEQRGLGGIITSFAEVGVGADAPQRGTAVAGVGGNKAASARKQAAAK